MACAVLRCVALAWLASLVSSRVLFIWFIKQGNLTNYLPCVKTNSNNILISGAPKTRGSSFSGCSGFVASAARRERSLRLHSFPLVWSGLVWSGCCNAHKLAMNQTWPLELAAAAAAEADAEAEAEAEAARAFDGPRTPEIRPRAGDEREIGYKDRIRAAPEFGANTLSQSRVLVSTSDNREPFLMQLDALERRPQKSRHSCRASHRFDHCDCDCY